MHPDQRRQRPRQFALGQHDVLGAVQSGARSGLRLLSLLRHEDVIAKAQVYAKDLVDSDPTLAEHPGLAALVGETVGDEERAAYLDKA